jgi:radical SAM enzyme (TIGR01210 family)
MSFSTTEILNARGSRNSVNERRPYHFLVEPEFSRNRRLENVATLFLTNRECPFRCLMCDLWQNTTTRTVPEGAIPEQIELALARLPKAPHVKLYNSGNFFDPKAIPRQDWKSIAGLVAGFQTVIVENHPRFCDQQCDEFQQLIGTQLEVAIGLETSHAPTLAMLNKQMTLQDFAAACELLRSQRILLRSFVLLRPPETSEQEGIERAIESVRFAFECGVDVCSIIPVRAGNGIMEQLQKSGRFHPPRLSSLEIVLQETLGWRRGRVFADLWDAKKFADQPQDSAATQRQIARLKQLNETQSL